MRPHRHPHAIICMKFLSLGCSLNFSGITPGFLPRPVPSNGKLPPLGIGFFWKPKALDSFLLH